MINLSDCQRINHNDKINDNKYHKKNQNWNRLFKCKASKGYLLFLKL